MNAKLIWVISCAIILTGFGCAHVQDTPHIRGFVYDETTHEPIADAAIHYERHPKQVVHTLQNGSFDFPRILIWMPALPIDRFYRQRLVVRATGYERADRDYGIWTDMTNELFLLRRER